MAGPNAKKKKKKQITMEMKEKKKWSECRDAIITFFIHYFHNDSHYVLALIESYSVCQV